MHFTDDSDVPIMNYNDQQCQAFFKKLLNLYILNDPSSEQYMLIQRAHYLK